MAERDGLPLNGSEWAMNLLFSATGCMRAVRAALSLFRDRFPHAQSFFSGRSNTPKSMFAL